MTQPLSPQRPSFFAALGRFLPFNRGNDYARRHQRVPCFIIGSMEIEGVGACFEGAVLELSVGGCSFRPASMYILERDGESIVVRTAAFEARGRIRATRPGSYGIQFTHELSPHLVEQALREHSAPLTSN